ncbi:HpsJ family protein [Chamaesiphon sp.]|uniref:HpsJ-like protein, cyanoexosortase A-associated n=1 Tax=Chamaesiphon sp. TaxID=2814140 RepID=UPI003592F17F
MTPVLVLFRVVGYGLLLLTLFDVVSAFIPLQLSNPGWQFQTAGGFVERSAVPLLGYILVFYDNQESRKKRELLLLKLLSWVALLSGIFYFALVIVLFITPPNINKNSEDQVNAQLNPRITQAQQIQSQLKTAQPSQIEALMKNGRVPAGTDPQAFKSKLMQEAATAEQNLQTQATITKNSQRLALFKNAIKWGLGAMVTAVLFIRIWAGTAWARQ